MAKRKPPRLKPGPEQPPLREELSLRAYARRRNVSHTAVVKAVKSGRLTAALVRSGRRIKVDPAKADLEWDANTDPARGTDPKHRAGGVAPGTMPANAGTTKRQVGLYGPELEDIAGELEHGAGTGSTTGLGLSEIRRQHIGIQARLAQLDLDERTGLLVRANQVRAEAFAMARAVRNAMLLIPNRVAPLLASETDAHTIRQMLTHEITNALEALSTAEPADG